MADTRLENVLGVMVPIVAIVGGISLAFAISYMRSKERLEMISRGMDVSLLNQPRKRRNTLCSGFTFVGAGLGLLLAYVLCHTLITDGDDSRVIYVGFVILFVGLGRMMCFWVDKNQAPDGTNANRI